MTETLPVHVWLPGATTPVRAGSFAYDADRPLGEFRYDPAYLEARAPSLAPDMPLQQGALRVATGKAIFPLLLDAGPDSWGRHMLARRLGRDITEFEALSVCPTDGVGNLALGDLTEARMQLLSIEQFLAILAELEAGGIAGSDLEERVLDAARYGTSLGGTKPKLTLVRNGIQYLAKFPEPGDSRWLPHTESAMLRLAGECGIRAGVAEVWHLPDGRAALLVERFDRTALPEGWARTAYVSAHALLRLDMLPPRREEQLALATQGFTVSGLRKSYVTLAADMAKWCGGHAVHLEERRELWRRIVFNALIRNLDDHTRNHGLLCQSHAPHVWRFSPAFDLVPARTIAQSPALAMAYRYIPPAKKGRQQTGPRLIARISTEDLLAAATEHYGYEPEEACAWLQQTAATVHARWQPLMTEAGMPDEAVQRFASIFSWAGDLAR
jgi:serine/threonine-protein kinase HipA